MILKHVRSYTKGSVHAKADSFCLTCRRELHYFSINRVFAQARAYCAQTVEDDIPPRYITKKRAIFVRPRPLKARHFRYIFRACALSTHQGSTKREDPRTIAAKLLSADCTAREIVPDTRAHHQIWTRFVTVSSKYEFSKIWPARSRIITPHANRSGYLSQSSKSF